MLTTRYTKRMYLFLFLFYLVCILTELSGITQSDINEHKQQLVDRLIQSANVLSKQQPRPYTSQELTLLTEGRFCLLDSAVPRKPSKGAQSFEVFVNNETHRQKSADQIQAIASYFKTYTNVLS